MKTTLILAAVALLVACKKPENPVTTPPTPDDHELITTLTLTLEDAAGILPTHTVTFRDLDGPGGNNPIQFDTIRLVANTTYTVQLQLYNELVTPILDVTSEIVEAATEHYFCITPTTISLGVNLTDSDGTFPIGIQSQWLPLQIGNGSVQIKLKHQPGGIKDGTCNPGGTDVEVNFVTEIN